MLKKSIFLCFSTANLFFNTSFKAARSAGSGFKLSMYHWALPSSWRHRRSYCCSGLTLHKLTYLSNFFRKSVMLSVPSPPNFLQPKHRQTWSHCIFAVLVWSYEWCLVDCVFNTFYFIHWSKIVAKVPRPCSRHGMGSFDSTTNFPNVNLGVEHCLTDAGDNSL